MVHHRRLGARRRERGQAILLAVVGLLILAIGMYTSYNLSRTVYEKIQLQNAADATAYSLATLEARTFNFIAFANRAQVANYVQMMEMQSILSNLTFMEGFFGWLSDLVISTGNLIKLAYFSVGEAIVDIGKGIYAAYTAIGGIVEGLDVAVPIQITLMTTKNAALFAIAAMLATTTALQLADGGGAWMAANDPDARRTWLSYALNVLNAVTYATAFDMSSMSMQGNGEDTLRAKRLITEIANATRYRSGQEEFVVDRGAFDGMGAWVDTISGGLGFDGGGGDRARGALQPIIDLANTMLGNVYGTTKMLTAESGLPDLEDTKSDDADYSALARGDAIAAKDVGFAPDWNEKFASVSSTPSAGEHCRYKKPGHHGEGSPSHLGHLSQGEGIDDACDSEGGAHIWQGGIGGGIQPFLNFAADSDGLGVERQGFNQPDVWIFLNKPPEGMALGGPGDLNFRLRQGPGDMVAELDARIGEDGVMGSGVFEGINVIARAQAYYHRPGAWREPPNFFNPYWGARLAPKGTALSALSNQLGLPGWAGELIADNVWMH